MTCIRYPVLPILASAGLALALGWALTINQQASFVLVVVLIAATAASAPASAWVAGALVAALSFKGLVSLGVLPSVATFVDLPLAWGALFVALLKQREKSAFLKRHLTWLTALALAVCLASAFNFSEVLRPILYLMLIGEPFAIVGALVADPPSPRMRALLERLLLALLLIQLPLVGLQAAKYGVPSDHIQGSLYLAGAGAHVISAVAVVGAIWILTGGIGQRVLGAWRLPIIVALFLIPFLADAKQVIVALPAIVLASRWRSGRVQFLGRATLACAAVVALFTLAPAGNTAASYIEQTRSGHGGKQATAGFVWSKLEGDPASVVFGKGPAETVSRAAFMTTDLFQRSDSPLGVLGLHPAAIAIEAQGNALEIAQGGTSFNSGVSSTLGVLGDLGIVGLAVYVGMFFSVFIRLRKEGSAEGIAAAAGLAIFLVLGLVFDWWEQPPFAVFLGVLAGLALTAERTSPRSPVGGPIAGWPDEVIRRETS